MLSQRYKIQFDNYNTKKQKLELQINTINQELNNINSKIEQEHKERILIWRELYKKSKQQGLPLPPKPITNYQDEIECCTSKIESIKKMINEKTMEIETLRTSTINNHYTNQDIINNEINIHRDEKDRINLKLVDINNEFINNTIHLLEIKTNNAEELIKHSNNLCEIEDRIINCKKTEKQNRFILLDILRRGNNLRTQFRNNNQKLQNEIDNLNKQYNQLQIEQKELLLRINHLSELQNENSNQYNDLSDQVHNLQYDNEVLSRKMIKINENIASIQEEQSQLKNKLEIDKSNLPNANNVMHPIETSYGDLSKQKNSLSKTVEYYKIQIKELDIKLELEKDKYSKEIANLEEEDRICNERLQIIIARCSENFNESNKKGLERIHLLDLEIKNYKRQSYLVSQELENWNNAFKKNCKHQYRKKQLLDNLAQFNNELEQINLDINTLNKAFENIQ